MEGRELFGADDQGVASRARATMPGVSSGELARELGVSSECVRDWAALGMPVLAKEATGPGKSGRPREFLRFEVGPCRAWMKHYRGDLAVAGKGGRRPGSGRKATKKTFTTESTEGTEEDKQRAEKAGKLGFSGGDARDVKSPTVSVDPNSPSALKTAAETRAANARAREIELRTAEAEGKLVAVEDVVNAHGKLYAAVAGRLDVVPASSADELMGVLGITDQEKRPIIEEVIARKIVEARADIAQSPLGEDVAEAA